MEVTKGEIYRWVENGKLYIVTNVVINKRTNKREVWYKEYENTNARPLISSENYFLDKIDFNNFKHLHDAVEQEFRFERVEV